MKLATIRVDGTTPAGRTPRSLADALAWARQGTALLAKEADALDDAALAAPSALPGWTRRHVLAHVAANADALGNLVHWAVTGEPTPMYASPAERAAGIERGTRLPAAELIDWLHRSVGALEEAMTCLPASQWQAPVVTAQGRTVPAAEVPWLRAREVCVHAVDLATGLSFAGLPNGFPAALCDDVIAKRATAAGPALVLRDTDTGGCWSLGTAPGTLTTDDTAVTLTGSLAEITAYLTGRPHRLTSADGDPAPALPAWL